MRQLLLLGLGLCLLPGQARGELSVGKYAKVFKGGEGITLTLVGVKPESNGMVLIKIKGTSHPVDDLVLLYRLDKLDRKESSYSTLRGGKRWSPFRVVGEGSRSYTLDLGEGRISMGYNEAESKKVDPRTLGEAYRRAVKDGKVQKLQALPAKDRQKLVQRELATAAEYYQKGCGFKIPVEIDWSSVTDEVRYFGDLTRLCEPALEALGEHCSSIDPPKAKKVRCQLGKKLDVRLGGGALVLTTSLDAEGVKDKAKAAFGR